MSVFGHAILLVVSFGVCLYLGYALFKAERL